MLRGYQNYRGRRSAAIKLLIAVLVVILVAACSFLFIQRYVTYTDSGGDTVSAGWSARDNAAGEG